MKKYYFDVSLFRDGSWLVTEKILLLGKGLILAYLFANFISKEMYGEYQYIVAFLGIVSAVIIPGMGTAIVQALARNKDGMFSRAIEIMFRVSFIGSLILISTAGYYFNIEKIDIAKIFLMLSVVFPGYIIMNFWRYYYTGKAQFNKLLKLSIILETISFISTVAAIIFFPQLLWLIILSIIFPIPFSIVIVWFLYKKTLNSHSDEDNVRFGIKISFAIGLSTLATYGDKLLLGHFLGFTELAIYSIAMIIPEQAKGALTSFMIPLLPQYSKDGENNKLKEHLVLFTIYSVLSVVIIYLLLPVLFKLVFSQYTDGILYAKYLLITLLYIPFVLLETFFRSQKKESIVFRATLIGSVSGIFLALILIPNFGILGAIVSKIGGLLLQGGSYALSYFYYKNSLTYYKEK